MVLVYISVWVSHLREGVAELAVLLKDGAVACHPFIIGELACGNLRNRRPILSLLASLPMAVIAEHELVLAVIEANRLRGKGLGYVDVHLLTSSVLTGSSLWTLDKRLEQAADLLHLK
jgi:predicted nucleic acid-binding protein